MRLKITSDGTVMNTLVTNAETGEVVEGVQAVSWSADVTQGDMLLATTHLVVRQVILAVTGEAHTDPVMAQDVEP